MANKRIKLGMLVMVLVFGMTVVGCASLIESMTPPTFSSDFSGTWIRPDSPYNYTLTLTSNTLRASNQNYYWNLRRVNGDRYTVSASSDSNSYSYIYIRLVNGHLEITETNESFGNAVFGDGGEHDWTGTWERQ